MDRWYAAYNVRRACRRRGSVGEMRHRGVPERGREATGGLVRASSVLCYEQPDPAPAADTNFRHQVSLADFMDRLSPRFHGIGHRPAWRRAEPDILRLRRLLTAAIAATVARLDSRLGIEITGNGAGR